MRFKMLLAAALVLSAAAGLSAQKQIQVLATVSDPGGQATATVDTKDVQIFEDGKPLTIVKVEPVDTTPKVQILVDNGLGMPAESIGDLRNALRNLVNAIPQGVEISLISTAPQPRFLERATTERDKVLTAVDRLAPDTGAGRFVESLSEATQRIERDKAGRYTIVSIATSSGDVGVRERDYVDAIRRVQERGTVVHVILLNSVNRSASLGIVQSEVGEAVTQASGGRFEKIAVANRIPSLLQEIGADLSKSLGGATRQFRVTAERAASGNIGKVSVSFTGRNLTSVVMQSGK